MHAFEQKLHQSQQPASPTRAQSHPAALETEHQEHPLLHAQRTIGNQAVLRLLRTEGARPAAAPTTAAPSVIQTKTAISQPGDEYEREADRVAEEVSGMAEPQFYGAYPCDSEKSGQGQLQTKRVSANDADEMSTPPVVSDVISSPGQPLDPTTRRLMESRFGHDFGQVRFHTGSRAADAARAVEARAFTVGHDIVFDSGQYEPRGTSGRRLLAHELTHVIQQRLGLGTSAAHAGGATAVRRRAPALSVQRQKAKEATPAAEDPAFWEWWKLVLGFEGSRDEWLKNPVNKKDLGGETNWGVTKDTYMKNAKALGLPATDEGFKAMTPAQAILFGRMLWKSSGAHKIKNRGVAIVLADWYWGGIDLKRFSDILKAKGRAATFKEGMPDNATLNFINTLPPDELVELMSSAKAEQYHALVKKRPDQKDFLEGWLQRNEKRRQQAQQFLPIPPTSEIWERGQRALRQARDVQEMGDDASPEQKEAAKKELWAVIGIIERKAKAGFAHDEEQVSLLSLKGELMKETSKLP